MKKYLHTDSCLTTVMGNVNNERHEGLTSYRRHRNITNCMLKLQVPVDIVSSNLE